MEMEGKGEGADARCFTMMILTGIDPGDDPSGARLERERSAILDLVSSGAAARGAR